MQVPQPILPPSVPKPQLVEPNTSLQSLFNPPTVYLQSLPTLPSQTAPTPPVLPSIQPSKFLSLSLVIETLQLETDIFNRLYNYSDWDLIRSSIVRKYADAKRRYLSSCAPTQTPYLSGAMQYNLNRLTALERVELTDAYQKYMENFYQRVVKYMWEYYENVFKRYQLQAESASNKAMFEAESSYVDGQLDIQRAITTAEMQRDYITAQLNVIKDTAEQLVASVDNAVAALNIQLGRGDYEEMKASNEVLRGKIDSLKQEFQGIQATLEAISAGELSASDYTRVMQSMIYEATQKTLKATAQAALEEVRSAVESQKANIDRMNLFKEKVELAKSHMRADADILRATIAQYEAELISIKGQIETAKAKIDYAGDLMGTIAAYAEAMVDQFRNKMLSKYMRDKERGHIYMTDLVEDSSRIEGNILKAEAAVSTEYTKRMKEFAGSLDAAVAEFKARLTNWVENRLTDLDSQISLTTQILHSLK